MAPSESRHRMKNILSSFFLSLTLTLLEIDLSEEIRWQTEPRTIQVCKGNTTDLCWDFDEDGSRIGKLEWYFNDTQLICIKSDIKELKVEPPYRGRIETFAKSSIRLKNISIEDEGRYTLFPVLSWHTSESMQTISLQVIEPPSEKCKCKISFLGHSSKLICDLPSSDCGRPQMSAVWKRSKTFEVLTEGNNFVINSSFHDKEILCCPQGIAMDCVDNFSDTFCTSISLQDDDIPSTTGNNLLQRHPSTQQVPNSSDTGCSKLNDHVIVILLGISITISSVGTALSFVSFIFICKTVKSNKNLVAEMQMMRKKSWHKDMYGAKVGKPWNHRLEKPHTEKHFYLLEDSSDKDTFSKPLTWKSLDYDYWKE